MCVCVVKKERQVGGKEGRKEEREGGKTRKAGSGY